MEKNKSLVKNMTQILQHYWKVLRCCNDDSGRRKCIGQNRMDVQSYVWEMNHMMPISVTENFAVKAPCIFESVLINF